MRFQITIECEADVQDRADCLDSAQQDADRLAVELATVLQTFGFVTDAQAVAVPVGTNPNRLKHPGWFSSAGLQDYWRDNKKRKPGEPRWQDEPVSPMAAALTDEYMRLNRWRWLYERTKASCDAMLDERASEFARGARFPNLADMSFKPTYRVRKKPVLNQPDKPQKTRNRRRGRKVEQMPVGDLPTSLNPNDSYHQKVARAIRAIRGDGQ